MDVKPDYTAAAAYYGQYRAQYPEEVINNLCEAIKASEGRRLLDLGCGPAIFSGALAKEVTTGLAIDICPAMIQCARLRLEQVKASNIQCLVRPAETIASDLGSFDFVVIGESLHWMNRLQVLQKCHNLLNREGRIAIVDIRGWWSAETMWQKKVIALVQEYVGPQRRANQSEDFSKVELSHREVLKKTPFINIETHIVYADYTWTIDNICGFLYSTSYCSEVLLGDKKEDFELALKDLLYKINAKGIFIEHREYTMLMARRAG